MLRTIVCAVFCAVFCLASTCHASDQYSIKPMRVALIVALAEEARPAIYYELRKEGEELPDSIRFHIVGFGMDYCVVGVQFPERVSDKTAFIAARWTALAISNTLNRYDHLSSLPPDVKFQAVAVPCVSEPGGVHYYDGYLWNLSRFSVEPPVIVPWHVIEEKAAR